MFPVFGAPGMPGPTWGDVAYAALQFAGIRTSALTERTETATKAALVVVTAVASGGGMAAESAGATAAEGAGVQTLNASQILFSQSSVRGVGPIAESMAANGWRGAPIDVVATEGGLVTVDNTRVLAASMTGTPVQAIVHGAGEALPASMAGRFVSGAGVEATTWGEAVMIRIGNQASGYRLRFPMGSWATGVSQ